MTDLCGLSGVPDPAPRPAISTPSRYVGNERNAIRKDLETVNVKFGLGFPDSYEVGMSHLGLKILYHILNEIPDVAAERVFTPWVDAVEDMRFQGKSLATLENEIPMKDLDLLGLSIQYELAATNVLLLLDLGRVPLTQRMRDAKALPGDSTWCPIVIGGGPVTFNPEPLSAFFDVFVIGEAEDVLIEVVDVFRESKQSGLNRGEILERLAKIPGLYVPHLYEALFHPNGRLYSTRSVDLSKSPARVTRRVVRDLNNTPFPTKPVIPFMNVIHDRVAVEIQRGCTRGCRFCQAGMIYRPTRQRSPEKVKELLLEALRNTGYEEASLMSLSNGDYEPLNDLLTNVMPELDTQKVALSLPSMRVDSLKKEVADQIKKVRKTGFTLAPEVGSARMRKIINKGITEENVLKATRDAFDAGWRQLKFYFMIGLPLETDEDIIAIAELAKKAQDHCGGRMSVTVSASTHSPKPHTPFQWSPMDRYEEILRKQKLLRDSCRKLGVKAKVHSPEMTVLEGVFARGDRRLEALILKAYEKGLIYAAWDDQFSFQAWMETLKEWSDEIQLPLDYWFDPIPEDACLPWDHIDCGVFKEWLLKDWHDAQAQVEVPDCAIDGPCTDCGGCDYAKDVVNRTFKTFANEPQRETLFPEIWPRIQGQQTRIRLQYQKLGKARFLGHLEVTRVFSRVLRQAGFPLKYSEGFHPLPRLVFSPPIPLGMESFAEWLDVTLETERRYCDLELIRTNMNANLPEGFSVVKLRFLEATEPGVIQVASGATVQTDLVAEGSELPGWETVRASVQTILESSTLPIVRVNSEGRTRATDARPFIRGLSLESSHQSLARLNLKFEYTPKGTVRPQELIDHHIQLPRWVTQGHWTKLETLGVQ